MHKMQKILPHFAEKPFHDIRVLEEFGMEITEIERDDTFNMKDV